jgi:hypothetical protein
VEYLALQGRERTIRALSFEEIDRPPMWGGWCENPKFLEKASGAHMKYGFTLNEWENPMRAALKAFKNVGVDVTSGIQLPKPPEMMSHPGGTYGYMGWEVSSTEECGYTPERAAKYIESLPKPEEVRADFDFDRQYRIYTNRMKRAQDECGDDMLWMSGASTVTFDGNFRLFGYRPYMIVCMRYRDSAKKLNAYYAEGARCQNEVIAKAMKEEDIAPFCFTGTRHMLFSWTYDLTKGSGRDILPLCQVFLRTPEESGSQDHLALRWLHNTHTEQPDRCRSGRFSRLSREVWCGFRSARPDESQERKAPTPNRQCSSLNHATLRND